MMLWNCTFLFQDLGVFSFKFQLIGNILTMKERMIFALQDVLLGLQAEWHSGSSGWQGEEAAKLDVYYFITVSTFVYSDGGLKLAILSLLHTEFIHTPGRETNSSPVDHASAEQGSTSFIRFSMSITSFVLLRFTKNLGTHPAGSNCSKTSMHDMTVRKQTGKFIEMNIKSSKFLLEWHK